MSDPIASAAAGAASGLASALPTVIAALIELGHEKLAEQVGEILGPRAKVADELAAQDAQTRAELGLTGPPARRTGPPPIPQPIGDAPTQPAAQPSNPEVVGAPIPPAAPQPTGDG